MDELNFILKLLFIINVYIEILIYKNIKKWIIEWERVSESGREREGWESKRGEKREIIVVIMFCWIMYY